jgi:hypothetical protein
MATELNCKNGVCEVPLFTWNGKDYSISVDEQVYKTREWVNAAGKTETIDPKKMYELLVLALPKQTNEDGSQKYPEMTPRPKPDVDVDKAWINERLKTSQPANYLEAYKYTSATSPTFDLVPPSQQAIKDWEENFPLAKKFYDEMSRYGLGQGATYGIGEDIGIQGDITPFKVFSQMYPGQSMLTEVGGAIPTGSLVAGLTRKAITNWAPEALIRTAPLAKRFWRFLANTAGSAAEATGHMFGWRYGHEMVDPEDPFTVERLSKAITGSHAGKDYTLAALLGTALPIAGRSYTAVRQMINNMKQRGGSDSMAMLRAAESLEASLPSYAKAGISEEDIMLSVNRMVDEEGMSLMDAVVRTQANIRGATLRGEAPVLHALPPSRDVGWAAGKAPEEATLIQAQRTGELIDAPKRMEDLLMRMKGGLADPRPSMDAITGGMTTRMQALYDRMERGVLDREVFRNLIKPKGSWNARTGNNKTYVDKGWDDTVEEVNATLNDPNAVNEHVRKFGFEPTRLSTRKEFLDNRYLFDSRESKALIDSGDYARATDTSGAFLPRVAYVDDAGKTRYHHILTKTNNTIDPKHAQMISQNIGKYARWKNPKDESLGAQDVRLAADIRGAKTAWDDVIGDAIPEYASANKLNNEINLIERSYDAGGKMTLETTGEGYNQFHDFIEEARTVGNYFDEGSEAFNNARNIFYGRAVKQLIGEGTTPKMILENRDIQTRLAQFIGNDRDYNAYMQFLLKEEAKSGVTQYLPAAKHQLQQKGSTGKEVSMAEPTLWEQAPHDVAMAAFSLPFWAGRRAGTIMGKIRGLENEQTAMALLRRFSATDRATKQDTIAKLTEELARLRSPIATGGAITRVNPLSAPIGFEGGFEYGQPSRRRRFGLLH